MTGRCVSSSLSNLFAIAALEASSLWIVVGRATIRADTPFRVCPQSLEWVFGVSDNSDLVASAIINSLVTVETWFFETSDLTTDYSCPIRNIIIIFATMRTCTVSVGTSRFIVSHQDLLSG